MFPKEDTATDDDPKEATAAGPVEHAPAARPPRRLPRLLAAAAVLLATLLAVALLWRPSGARSSGGNRRFAPAVLESAAPWAALRVALEDEAELRVTEEDLFNVAASALDSADTTVPELVRSALDEQVPGWIDALAGCRLRRNGLEIYLRCRRGATFYLTIEGRLDRGAGGELLFRPRSLHVGLLPLPAGLLREEGNGEVVIIDPDDAGVRVADLTTDEGSVTLRLERTRSAETVEDDQ